MGLGRRFLLPYSTGGVEYPINVSYLVIAGGGSGNQGGGGGGAGGYRTSYGSGNISGRNSAVETPLSINSATAYTIQVGGGGAADNTTSSDTPTLTAQGTKGNNSIFATITSIGGGCGTYYPASGYLAKNDGGSGGGAVFGTSGGHNQGNTSGTTAQGFGGHGGDLGGNSTYSGGGGGAGAAGNNTGSGAAGLSSSITGTAVFRGGGGSRGPWGNITSTGQHGGGNGGSATSGTPNTGGGGGGGGSTSSSQSALRPAGSGGSGVVILRFTQDASYTASAGLTYSESTDGTDKIVTFTGGTGTITFS